jgi:hypothetical protein
MTLHLHRLKTNAISIGMCFILFSFSSCQSDENLYIEKTLVTNFDIPSGLNSIETHTFRIRDIDLFLSPTLEVNGLDKNGTYEITGSKAKLFSRLSGADYSIIDRVSVLAVNPDNPADRIEMFYIENVPYRSLSELKLLTAQGNINKYIREGKIMLDVKILFKGFTGFPIKADLEFGYLIIKPK